MEHWSKRFHLQIIHHRCRDIAFYNKNEKVLTLVKPGFWVGDIDATYMYEVSKLKHGTMLRYRILGIEKNAK